MKINLKNLILVIVLSFAATLVNAQKYGNNWYFGNNAGINFSNVNPTAVTNGKLVTEEGCGTISDFNGNLLFYSDGRTVWNKNHQAMPNGSGLKGDASATQAVLFVPFPNDSTKYYLFTLDADAGKDGLRYSVVNTKLDKGLGDVEVATKDTQIYAPSTEKIAAVNHKNGKDVWVITHPWNSDQFWTYLITKDGIGSPVISPIGTFHGVNTTNSIGYMRASISGSRLALAISGMKIYEIFNFDNQTGIVSNPLTLTGDYDEAYGVEFSPNEKYLYTTQRSASYRNVYQFDLTAGTADAINKSKYPVGALNADGGAMQIAQNGVIYIAQYNNDYLGAILNPDLKGTACRLDNSNLYLAGSKRKSTDGFPTFNSSYFIKPIVPPPTPTPVDPTKFSFTRNCRSYTFSIKNKQQVIKSVKWYFEYPATDAAKTSTEFIKPVTYTYQIPNQTVGYTVKLDILYTNGKDSTNSQTVTIYAPLELGQDREICAGAAFYGPSNFSQYTWTLAGKSVSNSYYVYPQTSGNYSETVFDPYGCKSTDNINITVLPQPIIKPTISNVTTFRGTDGSISLEVTNGLPPYTYLWSNKATTQTITNLPAGTYNITVTDANKKCPVPGAYPITEPKNEVCSSHIWKWIKNTSGKPEIIKADKFNNIVMFETDDGNQGRAYIEKYDQAGKLLWKHDLSNRYGYEYKNCLKIDGDANIIVACYFKKQFQIDGKDAYDSEDSLLYAEKSVRLAVIKYDKDGNLIWCKQLKVIESYVIDAISFDIGTDNSIYMQGRFMKQLSIEKSTVTGKNYQDNFLLKLQPDGKLSFIKVYPITTSFNYNLQFKNNQLLWIYSSNSKLNLAQINTTTGDTISTKTFKNYASTYIVADKSDNLIIKTQTEVLKINIIGDELWKISDSKITSVLGIDKEDNIYISGNGNAYISKDGKLEILTDASFVFIAKIDMNGKAVWVKINQVNNYYFNSLAIVDKGNIFAVGYSSYNNKFDNLPVVYGKTVEMLTVKNFGVSLSESKINCAVQSTLIPTFTDDVSPYKYVWTLGSTTSTASSISVLPGKYKLTVTDAGYCTATDSIEIVKTPTLAIQTKVTNTTTYGASDGAIDLTVTGGKPPYRFLWYWLPSNKSTTDDLKNLKAGVYYITVTDTFGCSHKDTVYVKDPIKLALAGALTCNKGKDGTIDLTILGGKLPYTTKWSNGATTNRLTNLSQGFYKVTVSDGQLTQTDSINLLPKYTILPTVKQTKTCINDKKSSLEVSATGGTAPYWYKWSTSAIATTNSVITNLAGAKYSVTITDSKGCAATVSEVMEYRALPDFKFPKDTVILSDVPLTLSPNADYSTYLWQDGSKAKTLDATKTGKYWLEVTNEFGCKTRDTVFVKYMKVEIFIAKDTMICQGGTLHANSKYKTFLWNTGATTSSIKINNSGKYWVAATDANNLTYKDTVSVIQALAPKIDLGHDTSFCEGDSLFVWLNDEFSTYRWQNNDKLNYQNIKTSGVYWLEVTNENGCKTRDSLNIKILPVPKLEFNANPVEYCKETVFELKVNANSAIYKWQDSTTNEVFTIKQPGSYWIKATLGVCNKKFTISATEKDCKPNVEFPDVFTPNGDGRNDIFKVLNNNNISSFQIHIYNRWGMLIHQSTNPNECWDGKTRLGAASGGIYYYIWYTFGEDKKPYNGKGFFYIF